MAGLAVALTVVLAACGSSTPAASVAAVASTNATASPNATASASASPAPTPSPTSQPTASPTVTPSPTPSPTAVPALALTHCTGKSGAKSATSLATTNKYFAGYLDYGKTNNVTCIEASWVQPAISCPAGDNSSDAAITVTIAGYDGHGTSLAHQRPEEAGTDSYCDNGIPTYIPWTYTRQPKDDGYRQAPFFVTSGDQIWAQVTASGHNFAMTIADLTTHQISTVKASVNDATRENAQWMVQGPQVGCPKKCAAGPLASFGSVRFSGAEASINGVLATVDRWSRQSSSMVSGSTHRAIVSKPGSGTFTVTWKHK